MRFADLYMRRCIALLGVLLVAGCGQPAGPGPDASRVGLDCAPEVIGHRGEPSVAPEETMQSFRAAADHGARVLEGDIQFTKDGRTILLHDRSVDRTTDGSGAVKDLTFAQLRVLDAGGGAQIPSLTELIRFGKERNLRLVLELQSAGITRVQVQTVLVDINGMQQRTTVESFSAKALAIVQRLEPSMQTALITTKAVSGAIARASGTSLLPNIKVATKAKVQEWHSAGVRVYPWTLDDAVAWSKARRAGVDGVITNRTTDYLAWAAKGCPDVTRL